MKKRQQEKLIRFLQLLYALFGLIHFPKQFSKYARKDFDNWQLFALLVLRQKMKKSYAEFCAEWLPMLKPLTKHLHLRKIPHEATLRKFARRLKAYWVHAAIANCIKCTVLEEVIAGIDGTGSSIRRGSAYYYKRIGKKCRKKDFVKIVGVADMITQLVTALKIRKKARHDNRDFEPLMRRTRRVIKMKHGLGDKGFDAEKNHALMEELGAAFIAPLRNNDVPVHRTKGMHRKQLKRYFPKKRYGKRNKKETIWSVVKEKYGDVVRAVVFPMQKLELLFRFLAYNLDRLVLLGF